MEGHSSDEPAGPPSSRAASTDMGGMEPPAPTTPDPTLRAQEVEAFLRDLLQTALPAPDPTAPRGRGRPPLLPTMVLWAGILILVLRGRARQADLWRLLSEHGLWHFPRVPITSAALYQ